MQTLQSVLQSELKKLFAFPTFTAGLIRDQLKKDQIDLTDNQLGQIVDTFSKLEKEGHIGDTLHIEIDDDGSIRLGEKPGSDSRVIDLPSVADEKIKKIYDCLPEIVIEMSSSVGSDILKTLKHDARRMLLEHAAIQRGFDDRLYRKWKKPLQLMEMFIVIAEEAGSDYNDYISSNNDLSKAYKFEALRRLHARACQVSNEILVLLKSGYADGAHARWRTLHEISVVANFLGRQDNDLAERYLLHDVIERYQSSHLYQEYSQQLGLEQFSDGEIAALRSQYDSLLSQFGTNFANEYGWAAAVLGKTNPNFADIERFVEMRHIRPYYKMACINVHAGPRAALFRLGLSEEQQNQILLSGSSDLGLADPGENAVYSLLITTCSLLNYEPTLDCLVVLNILQKLEQEVFDAFDQAHHKLLSKGN